MALVPGNTLMAETPEEGASRPSCWRTRPWLRSRRVPTRGTYSRPGYATNADSLTMAPHVVAVEFATVAAANSYWRG